MSRSMKALMWSFFFGMTAGGLMAISIKYPLSAKALAEAEGMCEPNNGINKLKIGLSGKVYVVKCNNAKTFDLK